MIQYEGSDDYRVDLGTIKGTFNQSDIQEFILDILKDKAFGQFAADLELDYRLGYEEGFYIGTETYTENFEADLDISLKQDTIKRLETALQIIKEL